MVLLWFKENYKFIQILKRSAARGQNHEYLQHVADSKLSKLNCSNYISISVICSLFTLSVYITVFVFIAI